MLVCQAWGDYFSGWPSSSLSGGNGLGLGKDRDGAEEAPSQVNNMPCIRNELEFRAGRGGKRGEVRAGGEEKVAILESTMVTRGENLILAR